MFNHEKSYVIETSELGSRFVSLPWKHRKNAVEAV